MKILNLYDGTKIESELGYDSTTGWSIPEYAKSVEFEDGTILENPNFDLEAVKLTKIKQLEDQLFSIYQEKQLADSVGLQRKSEGCAVQIEQVNQQIEQIRMIGLN